VVAVNASEGRAAIGDNTTPGSIIALGLSALLLVNTVAAAQDNPARDNGERRTDVSEQAPAGNDTRAFDVWEYRVQGNSILDRKLVERVLYSHLGRQKTIEDVDRARVELERMYRDAGYPTVLVDIPEQDVTNGVVLLNVVEGKVDRLKITGSRYFSLGRIRSKVPSLHKDQVPYMPAVQEELRGLNVASAERNVKPVMRPGRTPGTLEVELKVKDELPLHGSVTVNDRDTQSTERLRTILSLSYANLWQREHSASIQYQTAPQDTDEVKVLSGTYLMRPGDGENLLMFYAVKSDSDVATAGDLTVIGDGKIIGGRYILPLASSATFGHSLSLGVDYKDFNESVNLVGADRINTPIEYLKAVAEYRGWRNSDKGRFGFATGLHMGLRGFFDGRREFDDKRSGARPNFVYWKGGVDYHRSLPGGLALDTAVDIQLADSPLISNEQYAAGGVSSVRGYYESQSLGDHAVRGSIELLSPDFGNSISERFQQARLLAFVDGAYLNVREALGGQDETFRLSGAGIGGRVKAFDSLSAYFYWAWAMNSVGDVDAGDQRAHFQVEFGF
jgi:hemolysin activation/secretion protein